MKSPLKNTEPLKKKKYKVKKPIGWIKFKGEYAWKNSYGDIMKLVQHYGGDYYYLVLDESLVGSKVLKNPQGTSKEAHFKSKSQAISFAKKYMMTH